MKSIAVILLLRHPKIVATMRDELVGLFKRSLVEQKFHPLARRHLALFMLPLAPLRAPTFQRHLVAFLQLGNLLFKFHRGTL